MPLYELDQYAENLLARQLSTLNGVAQVNVFGAAAFAVRLQVDPTALAARNIGIDQVAAAVQAANVNVATGTAQRAHPGDPDPCQRPVVRRRAMERSRSSPGAMARRCASQDVGNAIDSYQNIYAATWFNGKRAIVLNVQRQPGSNTIEIVERDPPGDPALHPDHAQLGAPHRVL